MGLGLIASWQKWVPVCLFCERCGFLLWLLSNCHVRMQWKWTVHVLPALMIEHPSVDRKARERSTKDNLVKNWVACRGNLFIEKTVGIKQHTTQLERVTVYWSRETLLLLCKLYFIMCWTESRVWLCFFVFMWWSSITSIFLWHFQDILSSFSIIWTVRSSFHCSGICDYLIDHRQRIWERIAVWYLGV